MRQSPICSRSTRFGYSTVAIISVQNQIFSGDEKEFTKVSRADGQAGSHLHCIPWNLAKPVKNDPGIIVRQHLTVPKQMVLLKEWCAELWKELLRYCCIQAWTKNGGLIPWNVTAFCEMFKTSHQTGKTQVSNGSDFPSDAVW